MIMALPVGSKAPDFELSTKNAEGIKLVKLSDNFGKTNTLLLFFPMAFTSVCTSELCSVSAGFATFDGLNTTVYGISGDSPFSLEKPGRRKPKSPSRCSATTTTW